MLKHFDNDKVRPLPYLLYSGASQVITIGEGWSFHTVEMYFAMDTSATRARFGYRIIGWLPVFSKKHAVKASREQKETDE